MPHKVVEYETDREAIILISFARIKHNMHETKNSKIRFFSIIQQVISDFAAILF